MLCGYIFCFAIAFYIRLTSASLCEKRNYGYNSVVCVCNSTYCDSVPDIEPIPNGRAAIFTSSQSGLRFERKIAKWTYSMLSKDHETVITIDPTTTFQKIEGFGGAFTDAAGINIAKLPIRVQKKLLSSYFGPKSIRYSIARVPMASCDFSTRNYSYDDVSDDFELEHFELTEEDETKKIPFIKLAMQLSKKPIKFIASPWSAPFWMKTNQMMQGIGGLIGEPGGKYYKTWANYFIKFLDEYAKHGIKFWAVTTQNEPTNGFVDDYRFQVMALSPEMERDFIKFDLGPALKSSKHKFVKIMMLDDRRYTLPKWAEVVLNDIEAAKHVSHIALHWYADTYTPIQILDETHEMFPQTSLFGTEACTGVDEKERVKLGDWERGEMYAENIIATLNHWYTGWTDWNLALDVGGGPNWVKNFVDSPIIVNYTSGEFYKQPMFYAIGHFSAFLPEGSVRLNVSRNYHDRPYMVTSFQSPDGYKVAIIFNKGSKEGDITIAETFGRFHLDLKMLPKSIQTVIWK